MSIYLLYEKMSRSMMVDSYGPSLKLELEVKEQNQTKKNTRRSFCNKADCLSHSQREVN